VQALLQRRAILVTGKGGVGKTTVAAALARALARTGRRVLASEVSYEPHATSPLARALGIERTPEEPEPVAENLSAVLLTPTAGHARFLRDVLPLGMLADAALKSAAIRRFLHAAPTLSEIGILYRLLELVRRKRSSGEPEHQTIVVDLPATGHTLALAQVPGAVVDLLPGGPIAAAAREGLDLLKDTERTTAIIVTLPESLPVSEAVDLAEGLRRHRVPIGRMVLNRMPDDPFDAEERAHVEALLEGRGPVLGARALPRIDRARAAVHRLRAEGAPIALVGEFDGADDAQITDSVSKHLATALAGSVP
jgi:anion-transporting  ArsA/GET3 family ATPase